MTKKTRTIKTVSSTKSEQYDKVKAANTKLKKQVASLRKKIKLLEDEIEVFLSKEDATVKVKAPKEGTVVCTSCEKSDKRGSVVTIPAGKYKIVVCEKCGWRERILAKQ